MVQRSIFTRMFKIFMSITTLSVVGLAFILNGYLNTYFINQREETLLEQCVLIQEQYTLFQEQYDLHGKSPATTAFQSNFIKELSALDKYLKARILLIDKTGLILIDSKDADSSILRTSVKYRELTSVFKGDIVTIKDYNNPYFDEPILLIGYPIKSSDNVVSALFVHSPLPEITKTSHEIFSISLFVILSIFLIASIAILIMGSRFKYEFYRIIRALKNIAKGDFSERILTNRQDELAEIAHHINYMANELDTIESSRRTFISNISHDLRSPLTSISGYSQAILDHTIPVESQDRYLRIINSESLRLKNLANSLISLTKFESFEILEKKAFDINQLLLSTLDSFENRIEEKNLHVDIQLTDKPLDALGAPDQIERVIYNLIDNAIKFSPNDGLFKISIVAEKKHFLVSICNEGPTIDTEELNQIWNRFYKSDSSRGKNNNGYGLGLAIVREIILNHKEQIFVESCSEHGTSFSFTLEHQARKVEKSSTLLSKN
jgi:signal transduction histidine kinase